MDGLSAAQGLRLVFADNVVEAGVDPMKPLKTSWSQKVILTIAAIFLVGKGPKIKFQLVYFEH